MKSDKQTAHALSAMLISCWLLVPMSAATLGVAQNNPVPLVNLPLVPDAVAPGSAGFTLTVNGTGFVSGSAVNWSIGGATTPLATTFVSGSQLTAAVPAGNVATAGTASIIVKNPAPGGGVSNSALLQITIPTSLVSLTRTDYPVLTDPDWITTGDFNGDGKPDLAVAGFDASSVAVLLGNGDGTFQTAANYPTGAFNEFIVIGDFNGDGIQDLITANQFGAVSVLLGNGDGTFQPYKETTVGSAAQWIAVGDFNQDGKDDIAVVDQASEAVWILLGNGNGTFQTPAAVSTLESPEAVTVGDFNGDGKLDIAVDGYTGTEFAIAIALGNGDGTFQAPLDYPTPGGFPVTAVDLNRDGILDVAVGVELHVGQFAISILIGNGDGTFKPYADYAVSGTPRQIVAGDFNGDGKVDLAEATSQSNEMAILLGNGDGTFQAQTEYSTAADPIGLAAADFNRDGALDLAVVNDVRDAATFSVFLQEFVPEVTLSPASLTFSGENLGVTSQAQTVTLTNTGNAAMTISSLGLTGVDPGDFAQTNTCPISPATLAIGASCTISVTFTPTAEGTRTAAVSITDNAPGSPQAVPLTGTGDAPVVSLSPSSINFGNVLLGTTSQTVPVALTNVGNEPLSITKIAASPGFGRTINQRNGCTTTLAAGATCTIEVDFDPTQPGKATGTLSVTDNAAGSPQTVALSGTGLAFELSTTSLNFGKVPVGQTSSPQTVTVNNLSKTAQSISIRVTGTGSGEFPETNNCGTSLAAHSSCGITVTFTPTRGGTASAALDVNGGGADQTVSLSGTGTH
jgi:hypothetical protein